jgi:hypothetical protein
MLARSLGVHLSFLPSGSNANMSHTIQLPKSKSLPRSTVPPSVSHQKKEIWQSLALLAFLPII